MNIIIKNNEWEILLFDDEEFVKHFGDSISAFVNIKDKQMIFNEDDVDLQTVIHEITHVYISYLDLNNDLEEIFCEMMANDGDKIIKQSRALLRKIRRT